MSGRFVDEIRFHQLIVVTLSPGDRLTGKSLRVKRGTRSTELEALTIRVAPASYAASAPVSCRCVEGANVVKVLWLQLPWASLRIPFTPSTSVVSETMLAYGGQ